MEDPRPCSGRRGAHSESSWSRLVLLHRHESGETKALIWADFDRETWTIRLHARDSKNRKGRAIPLENELREVIERRIAARQMDCPYIFHRKGHLGRGSPPSHEADQRLSRLSAGQVQRLEDGSISGRSSRWVFNVEAPNGIEPLTRSVANCALSHLGTAPLQCHF